MSEAASTPWLRLQLRAISVDAGARASWTNAADVAIEYDVDPGALAGNVVDLRKNLDAFLQAYMRDARSPATADAMRGLLEAGHTLYLGLFTPKKQDDAAEDARDQYERLAAAGPLRLYIKLDPALAMPWALAVPKLQGVEEVCADPNAPHELFWGLRHELVVSTFGSASIPNEPLSPGQVQSLAAMHRRIFDAASASSDLSDAERRMAELYRTRCGQAFTFDFSSFLAAAGTRKGRGADAEPLVRIAYLLGHANGDNFQLSDRDTLSAGSFVARLSDATGRSRRQSTLLFLNGCQTAVEAQHFPFTSMLAYSNIGGMIGTEVRVPDLFGFRFALAFFRLVFVDGLSFRDAMTKLRREHLPISLAYSLYAADGLALVAEGDAELTRIEGGAGAASVNLSTRPVKCAQTT